jgi:phosphatidylglycerol:prolipoprotein diacylglycerol transferase
MLKFPAIDPVAIALGPVKIHWYGLMYVVGFLGAWWLGRYRARQPGSTWKPEDIDDVVFFAVWGVVLGGRLGYLLFYGRQALAEDPGYWYRIWDGGMSFHGGLIGALVALAVLAWRRQRRIIDVFDFAAPLPLIGFFAVRIGNFLNSELWGKPTTVPWGVEVTRPASDGSFVTQVLHPSQLYEALLEGLVLFLIVWWFTSRPRPRWAASGLFLVGYSTFRILIEFVRVPDVQLGYLALGWVTMGQLLSLPMLLAGLAMLGYAYAKREPSGNYAPQAT